MSLEKALKKYNEVVSLANLDLSTVESKFRPGRESQKRDAEMQLESVRKEYLSELSKSLMGIHVTGPGADSFGVGAIEVGSAIVIDAGSIFAKLADAVGPSIGQKGQFGTTQFGLLIQEIRNIAQDISIDSIPAPRWSEPLGVPTREELVKQITRIVVESLPVDFVKIFAMNQILAQALQNQEDRVTVPVVVKNLDASIEEAFMSMFIKGKHRVETKEDVKSDFVTDTFANIKKQLKSQKKNNN